MVEKKSQFPVDPFQKWTEFRLIINFDCKELSGTMKDGFLLLFGSLPSLLVFKLFHVSFIRKKRKEVKKCCIKKAKFNFG